METQLSLSTVKLPNFLVFRGRNTTIGKLSVTESLMSQANRRKEELLHALKESHPDRY